jgi:hypothetical protein
LKELTIQQPEAYLKNALDLTAPKTADVLQDLEIEIVSNINHNG